MQSNVNQFSQHFRMSDFGYENFYQNPNYLMGQNLYEQQGFPTWEQEDWKWKNMQKDNDINASQSHYAHTYHGISNTQARMETPLSWQWEMRRHNDFHAPYQLDPSIYSQVVTAPTSNASMYLTENNCFDRNTDAKNYTLNDNETLVAPSCIHTKFPGNNCIVSYSNLFSKCTGRI